MTFEIPGPAPSVANMREHWAAKAKRTKQQRDKARLLCPTWRHPLLLVTLTRVAPRELDFDNLLSAMKAYRDGIAAKLRVDDSSPLVAWQYAQRKCAVGKECTEVILELAP